MDNDRILLDKDRLLKVSNILVSQPEPSDGKSPYFSLSEKYKIQIDFRPFIEIDPVDVKEFRKQKVSILDHTAVIFTSRNAVDHFFRLAAESKVEIPTDMKYFCISEQT
ncbi:MAG: uroporphyrinogen-III synthase, partial [Cellvibrionaceae bacterium]